MSDHYLSVQQDEVYTYEIVVSGILSPEMSDLVAGMEIRNERNSILKGKLKDQSELMGVLNTLVNYRSKVLSVKRLDEEINLPHKY